MSGVAGAKVVELSHMVAAPVTGTILADLGADVLKVEPTDGDAARGFGERGSDGLSTLFRCVNRGKRGAVLDLTTSEGRGALLRMLAQADCLVTNYRPSALERNDLGLDALHHEFPALVIASITAYPDERADWPGVDVNALGLSGLMLSSGWPGMPPIRPALPLADMTTGILAALGIVDALFRRGTTGRGEVLRFSLSESVLYLNQVLLAHAVATGENPPRLGNGSPFGFTGCFEAADGYLTLAAPSDRLFEKFCQLIERPDLARTYPTHGARAAARDELERAVKEVLRGRPVDAWVQLLRTGGVPCARVNDALQAVASPEAMGKDFLRRGEDPRQVLFALPWTRDGYRPFATRPAPPLGSVESSEVDL